MTWKRPATGHGAATILGLLLAASMAVPAVADDDNRRTPETAPATARFEGRTIDLHRDWGDARTCVVWSADAPVDCYRTEQAADQAVRRREAQESRQESSTQESSTQQADEPASDEGTAAAPLASSCASWLTLYDGVGWSGVSVRFRDRGYWQDLGRYGFAYRTSSYTTGACSVTLADAGWTAYPGYTGPYYSAYRMASGWNNRVRYLKIH